MATPLDIYARLNVSITEHQINVRADGQIITVDLHSLSAGRALFNLWRSRHERVKSLGNLTAMMTQRDLQLELRLHDRMIVRLGSGIRPSLSSRLLGLSPLELRPVQILRAITRQKS